MRQWGCEKHCSGVFRVSSVDCACHHCRCFCGGLWIICCILCISIATSFWSALAVLGVSYVVHGLDCIDDRGLDVSICDNFSSSFFLKKHGPKRPASVTGKFWILSRGVMVPDAVTLQSESFATSQFQFFRHFESALHVVGKHRLGRLGIWKGHTHVLDRWCCGLTSCLACWVYGACFVFQHVSPHGFPSYDFDSTKGYPGEGPWTLSTINVGSLEKHEEIYQQKVQCLAIQETRITDANSKKCHLHASACEFDLHCGPHLGYLPSGHPAWGGVAIASEGGSSIPFESKHDSLGIWPSLWASARVCAQWVAVSPSTTMLIFSFYGYPNAGDANMKNSTNLLLQQILLLCSQFGRIPIAICGDFQEIPHNYPALRAAFEQGLWHDPHIQHSADGYNRSITFSRNRKWKVEEGATSSIDGILLNDCAFQFVTDAQVRQTKGLQHAFVSISFQWPDSNPKGKIKGFKWRPHAALDLSLLKPMCEREKVAEELWQQKYEKLCQSCDSAQSLMEVANEFSLNVLLKSGAKWRQGSRIRGRMPIFEIAGLDKVGGNAFDAKSKHLNRIVKTLSRIDDLSFKIAQGNPTPNCERIANAAWMRIQRALSSFGISFDCLWPSQDDLLQIWQSVSDLKDKLCLQIRRERADQWKKKMEHSAVTDFRDVFKFLKLKHRIPSHTVVTDQNNCPIYNPVDAIKLAREQWNPIFDDHKESIPTDPFVRVVGPLLDSIAKPCEFCDIDPSQLFDAIQSRPNETAGGVDGWRTVEMKALPVKCFHPWAKIWNQIENGVWEIPQIFQVARLTMLPKPGAKTHQPIDRRLINLMNIHYLLWSKVRFQHLSKWQTEVFPVTVCGGVKGRQTSDIAHNIAVRTELALATNDPVVGVKIDRSKCFDRIAVNIIECIARRLGVPERFLRVWTQIYKKFQRFLTLGQYIDCEPLASSNGVAQGDSASVLAVNLLMSAWAVVMKIFPNIEAFVFIDDGYLMTKAAYIEELSAAVHTTKLFDKLVGQKFNPEKSSAWATSKNAKKLLKENLPDIPCKEYFEVLGAYVKSTSRSKTFDTISQAEIIRQVIKDISFLPIGLKQKAFLIRSKAISKLLYLPELCPWSRLSLDSFQANIIAALWGNRPSWRCTELVFGLLTKSVQSHPQHAIASQIVVNISTRCRKDSGFFQLWCSLCLNRKVTAKGIIDAMCKSCATLGLEFTPPSNITFLGHSFSFLEITPRLLRRILRVASVQSLYKAAIHSGRKDLVSGGSGVIDSDLSVFREPGLQWKIKGLDPHVVVGPMVGACPTGDRLYKGGLLDTPKCRFCSSCDKEDIRHLTGECTGIISLLGHPGRLFPEHPNFLSHGIREAPQFLLDAWANSDIPTVSSPAAFQCEAVRVWGDGSVYNGDHFFTKTLGFALINQDGSTICTKGWQDPFGCSYKAELYALLHCVQIFQGYIEFTTDCSALLKVWQVVQCSSTLEDNLAYRDEWTKIKQLVYNDGHSRLTIFWIKAHQVDFNYCLMSESQRNNRVADQVASKSAREASPVTSQVVESWRHFTRLHWIWLCKLTKLISDKKSEQGGVVQQHTPDAEPTASEGQQMVEQFRNRFCKWDWGMDIAAYGWRMQVQQCNTPAKWNHSNDLWNKTVPLPWWHTMANWSMFGVNLCSCLFILVSVWHYPTRFD